MTRHILDTNIISEAAKPAPSEALVAWLSERADEDLFIATPTETLSEWLWSRRGRSYNGA